MGVIGRYVIQVTCANGRTGYYMDINNGCIELTQNVESATRFMSQSGAHGYADRIDWTLPAHDGKEESTVVSVNLYKLLK